MVKVIILAGGRLLRMPGETLKQYRRVNNDKMLVSYSIEAFIRGSKVDSITVVVEDESWLQPSSLYARHPTVLP